MAEPTEDEILEQQLAHYKALGSMAGTPSAGEAETPDD